MKIYWSDVKWGGKKQQKKVKRNPEFQEEMMDYTANKGNKKKLEEELKRGKKECKIETMKWMRKIKKKLKIW